MEKNEIVEKKGLKFPSHMEYITANNIHLFFDQIGSLPDRFKKEDVTNLDNYPIKNINSIGRLLSYIKYLGFVNEQRSKEGKKQLWVLLPKALEIKKAILFQKEKYPVLLRKALKDTKLYKFIAEQEEIKNYNRLELNVFETIIYDRTKYNRDKVIKARKFTIDLLTKVDLINIEDGTIKLTDSEENEDLETGKNGITTPPSPTTINPNLPPQPQEGSNIKHYQEAGAWSLFILDNFDIDSYTILKAVLNKVKKQYGIKDNEK